MAEWQSIETAPKDGTKILARSTGNEPYMTRWHDDVWAVQGGSGGPSGWFSGRYSDRWGDSPVLDRPEEWIPVPA